MEPALATRPGIADRLSLLALRWAGRLIAATAWISAALFGTYVLAYYVGAVPGGVMAQWNRPLPRLYEPGTPFATLGMGLHFLTGAILLLLGPIQLIAAIRDRYRTLHRWLGRLYAGAAFLTGLGGLAFIAAKGTVGGTPMTIGFGLYGTLMVIASVQTYRHARARRIERHRAWAIRLFALTIGSWLYRMDYGFWSILADDWGESQGYDGPFDIVMAFFFYLPNLVVAELFIRGAQRRKAPALRGLAAASLGLATALLVIGTYFFTRYYWAPGIARRLIG